MKSTYSAKIDTPTYERMKRIKQATGMSLNTQINMAMAQFVVAQEKKQK